MLETVQEQNALVNSQRLSDCSNKLPQYVAAIFTWCGVFGAANIGLATLPDAKIIPFIGFVIIIASVIAVGAIRAERRNTIRRGNRIEEKLIKLKLDIDKEDREFLVLEKPFYFHALELMHIITAVYWLYRVGMYNTTVKGWFDMLLPWVM